jgi:hypothetical protein
MNNTRLLLLSIATASAVFLSGCTPYKSNGIMGGYTDTQLAPDVFRIGFQGNGYTSTDRTQDFALLRAADLAIKQSDINNCASFPVGVQTLDFGKSSYSWTAGVTNVARLSKVESIGLKYAQLFMSLCLATASATSPFWISPREATHPTSPYPDRLTPLAASPPMVATLMALPLRPTPRHKISPSSSHAQAFSFAASPHNPKKPILLTHSSSPTHCDRSIASNPRHQTHLVRAQSRQPYRDGRFLSIHIPVVNSNVC